MRAAAQAARQAVALFVADPVLAGFVPVCVASSYLCMHLLPTGMRSSAAVNLSLTCWLAGGPMAALWWSVRRAARAAYKGQGVSPPGPPTGVPPGS